MRPKNRAMISQYDPHAYAIRGVLPRLFALLLAHKGGRLHRGKHILGSSCSSRIGTRVLKLMSDDSCQDTIHFDFPTNMDRTLTSWQQASNLEYAKPAQLSWREITSSPSHFLYFQPLKLCFSPQNFLWPLNVRFNTGNRGERM